MKAKLQSEVNRGLDRTERKLHFFEGTNTIKTEAMKEWLEVYETFRRILDDDSNEAS